MIRHLLLLTLATSLIIGCKPDRSPQVRGKSEAAGEGVGPAAAAERSLPEPWYLDGDGNAVPDFIELAEGDDPNVDRCATTAACDGAGDAQGARPQGVLLLLDASGSMGGAAGGETKIGLAKSAIARFLAAKPSGVEAGLLAYGHRGDNTPAGKAASCAGIELIAPIGSLTGATASQTLARFEPTGWTPIAAALSEAANALPRQRASRLVLVSDGVETCGGDPVSIVGRLRQSGVPVTVDVIGFDVARQDARQLREIAAAGDGSYFDVRTAAQFDAYFDRLRAALAKEIGGFVCEANAFNRQFRCDSFLAAAFARRVNHELMSGLGRDDPAARTELLAQLGRANAFVRQRHAATTVARSRADAHMQRASQLGQTLTPR